MSSISNKKSGYGMCNPVIKKMRDKADAFIGSGTVASYKGIAVKTGFFISMAFLGFALYFIMHNIFLSNTNNVIHAVDNGAGIYSITTCGEELAAVLFAGIVSLVAPLLAWFIRGAIPVAGTIYAICEGYFVGFITGMLASNYKWISFVAFILTVAVVGSMLYLYTKRIIVVHEKFKMIVTTLFLSLLVGSVLLLIAALIPFTRTIAMAMFAFMGNPVISIGLSILYLVLAIMFLLVDFNTIESCVENGMPVEYEWMAAWGLAYTIIYIYFKILNLILKIIEMTRND